MEKFSNGPIPKDLKDTYYFIEFEAKNVHNVEIFSKSDPFICILRQSNITEEIYKPEIRDKRELFLVKRTEYHKDTLKAKFEPFFISSSYLTLCNESLLLRIEIWDHSKRGKHKKISTGNFTVKQILEGRRKIETFNKKGSKNYGTIYINNFVKCAKPSFKDIQENLNFVINPSILIDFSGKNEHLEYENCLHFIKENGKFNDYENLILSIFKKFNKENLFDKNYLGHISSELRLYGFGCTNEQLIKMNKKEFSKNFFEFSGKYGEKNLGIVTEKGQRMTSVELITQDSQRIRSGWMTDSVIPDMILSTNESNLLCHYRSVLNQMQMEDYSQIKPALQSLIGDLNKDFQATFLRKYQMIFICFGDYSDDFKSCLKYLEEIDVRKLPLSINFVKMEKESLVSKRLGESNDNLIDDNYKLLGKRVKIFKLRDYTHSGDCDRNIALERIVDGALKNFEEEFMEFYDEFNEIWW